MANFSTEIMKLYGEACCSVKCDVLYGVLWYRMVCCGMVWYIVVWNGVLWHGTECCGMVFVL